MIPTATLKKMLILMGMNSMLCVSYHYKCNVQTLLYCVAATCNLKYLTHCILDETLQKSRQSTNINNQ